MRFEYNNDLFKATNGQLLNTTLFVILEHINTTLFVIRERINTKSI